MPTVLITGCSSGFGLETAKLFLERERPSPRCAKLKDDILPASDDLTVLPLDVTDPPALSAPLDGYRTSFSISPTR